MYKTLIAAVASLIVIVNAPRAQGAAFVNLNFEQAMIPPGTPPGIIAADMAFPGWTARWNDTVVSLVYYNQGSFQEPLIELYDRPEPGTPYVVYEGWYSARLGFIATQTTVSLSQVGDIPGNARSIRLLGDLDGIPVVLMNGSMVPMQRLDPHFPPVPTLWGGDVTAFAGQTVELRMAAIPPLGSGPFDHVQFSSVPIPEAQALGVMSVLYGCVLRRCRRA